MVHRVVKALVYVAAISGVVHYWWLVKADVRLPMAYAAVLVYLLGYRTGRWLSRWRLAALRPR
ncbi:MAG: hypothetical protein IMZ67_09520 [Acidobacteria bacterium]|nr:hypothetical protein [Acidobacteriota bacterium]